MNCTIKFAQGGALYFNLLGRLKKLRRLLQLKRHYKVDFWGRWCVLLLIHIGHVVRNGWIVFNTWLPRNGFHVKTDARCRQNLNFEMFGRLRQRNILIWAVAHVQHDYLCSFE